MKIIKIINEFGNIYFSDNFEFKFCSSNINSSKKYKVSGEKNNIITKLGSNKLLLPSNDSKVGVLFEKSLEKIENIDGK